MFDSSPVSTASCASIATEADGDDRDEVLERHRQRDRAADRRRCQPHDVGGAVDLHAGRTQHVGSEHDVVTVAPKVVEHHVVGIAVGRVADAQRTGANDLRGVSAEPAHRVRADDRRREPARELGAHRQPRVTRIEQAAHRNAAHAAVHDRRHRFRIGRYRGGASLERRHETVRRREGRRHRRAVVVALERLSVVQHEVWKRESADAAVVAVFEGLAAARIAREANQGRLRIDVQPQRNGVDVAHHDRSVRPSSEFGVPRPADPPAVRQERRREKRERCDEPQRAQKGLGLERTSDRRTVHVDRVDVGAVEIRAAAELAGAVAHRDP